MNRRLRELWVVITDDRKKATVLGVLLLALIAMGAKTLLGGIGPRGSSAAVEKERRSSADMGQNAVSRTMAALGATLSSRVITLPKSPPLSRNLFAMDSEFFPPPVQKEPVTATPKRTGNAVVEALPENADVLMARAIAQIEQDAKSLRLRSIVLGATPNAVIETKRGARQVVRIGQPVDGFVVVAVESSSVVLEKNSVRVRLSLTRPER